LKTQAEVALAGQQAASGGKAMEYPISYPGLDGQKLAVRQQGLSKAQLLQNGVPLKKQGGCYTVQNDAGEPVAIRLKSTLIDLIPKVIIGEDTIHIAPPLRWYEHVWTALPVLMVFIGGALGGGLGGAATLWNAKIFRSDRPALVKYSLTALISSGAFFIWFAVVSLTAPLIQQPAPQPQPAACQRVQTGGQSYCVYQGVGQAR
jgi:hypothetical protein